MMQMYFHETFKVSVIRVRTHACPNTTHAALAGHTHVTLRHERHGWVPRTHTHTHTQAGKIASLGGIGNIFTRAAGGMLSDWWNSRCV
jgi:hypothetical protein